MARETSICLLFASAFLQWGFQAPQRAVWSLWFKSQDLNARRHGEPRGHSIPSWFIVATRITRSAKNRKTGQQEGTVGECWLRRHVLCAEDFQWGTFWVYEKSINFDESFTENSRGRDESGNKWSPKNVTIETSWESVRPGLECVSLSGLGTNDFRKSLITNSFFKC